MSDRLCSLGMVCTHCPCGRSWYCHILQDRHTSPPCLARDTGCHLSWPSVLPCKSPPRMPGEGWTWLRAEKKSSESLILGHVDAPGCQCGRELRQVRVRGVHGWARHPRQPCPRSTAIWAAPAAAAGHLQAAPHRSPPRPRNLPQKLPWHAAAAPASRRRDGVATGPRFQPPSPRVLAGEGIWEVVGAGCGQPLCCVDGCRACPYCLLLLLHKPTRVVDGHFFFLVPEGFGFPSLGQRDRHGTGLCLGCQKFGGDQFLLQECWHLLGAVGSLSRTLCPEGCCSTPAPPGTVPEGKSHARESQCANLRWDMTYDCDKSLQGTGDAAGGVLRSPGKSKRWGSKAVERGLPRWKIPKFEQRSRSCWFANAVTQGDEQWRSK